MNETAPPAVAGPVEPTVRPLAQLVERIGSPPDTHCWDDDSAADCWSYSPQMVADLLDAERERACDVCDQLVLIWKALRQSATLTSDTMEAMKLTAKICAAETMKRNIRGA
jgi:hypothetical protein